MSPAFLLVEGGGDGKAGRVDCRQGFRRFLEHAKVTNLPRIVACGGRQQAFEKFKIQLSNYASAYLLVDSEEPVHEAHRSDPWQHLQARDGWQKPPLATADHCHLMAQVLEAWFLADPEAMAGYFGQGFKAQKLGNPPDIEAVSKPDVYGRIRAAVKDTRKQVYDKGRDTCEILGKVDPEKVSRRSYFVKRFLEALS